MPAYQLRLDMDELMVLVTRTRFPLSSPSAVRHMGDAMRRYGAMVQARAVWNVSGYPVVYQGGVFRVQVKTGALKGAIEMEWPYGTVFTVRVYVNGAHTAESHEYPGFTTKPTPVNDYAGAIEFGHDEIDLKKTMKGKTVPFFASRAKKPRGPYAAGDLKPLVRGVEGYGSSWQSRVLNAKLTAQGKNPMVFTKEGGKAAFKGGKTGSSYFISFRRVGNQGWVIPAARPRPFMRAALEGTSDQGRLQLVRAGVEMLDPRK